MLTTSCRRPADSGGRSRWTGPQRHRRLTRDEILDNISLYWLTNTGVSARGSTGRYKGGFFNAMDISIPAAVTVFPSEKYQAPRSWAEHAYPNLIYFNEVDRGGHFAAWEQPELLAQELRAAFRSLR